MQNRRFTRLTNAFSKKLENHAYMLAITMVFYNFCRKHKSLGGKTPAMVAGLTDYVWTASDLLSLDLEIGTTFTFVDGAIETVREDFVEVGRAIAGTAARRR